MHSVLSPSSRPLAKGLEAAGTVKWEELSQVKEELDSGNMEARLQANSDNFKRHKNFLVDSKEQHQKEQELLLRSIKGFVAHAIQSAPRGPS